MGGVRKRDSLPDWLVKVVLSSNDGRCVYCDENPATDLDHIVPFSRGGSCAIENRAPACEPCNSSKGNQSLSQWIDAMGRRFPNGWFDVDDSSPYYMGEPEGAILARIQWIQCVLSPVIRADNQLREAKAQWEQVADEYRPHAEAYDDLIREADRAHAAFFRCP